MTTVNHNVHVIDSSAALKNISEHEDDIDDNKTEGKQQNADSTRARRHSSRTDKLQEAAAEASHLFSRNGIAQLTSLQQGRIEQNCDWPNTRTGQMTCVELMQCAVQQPASIFNDDIKAGRTQQNADPKQAKQHSSRTDRACMLQEADAVPMLSRNATAQHIRLQRDRANLELGKTRAGKTTCVELAECAVRQPASWSTAGPIPPIRTPYAAPKSLLDPALSVDSCRICPSTIRLGLSRRSVTSAGCHACLWADGCSRCVVYKT